MKAKITEVFYSLQGEGSYIGTPSVFVRFWGCNMTCAGFSNPHKIEPSRIPAILLDDLNMEQFAVGCDSRYSWHKDFNNLAQTVTIDELIEKIQSVLPDRKWVTAEGYPIHLVLTGGEPTLYQKQIVELLSEMDFRYQHDTEAGLQYVTIETNASLQLRPEFLSGLRRWSASPEYRDRMLTWSNSPKLSFTQETRERAIKGDVITQQLSIPAEFYFKFVARPLEKDFEEIREVMDYYISYVNRPHLFNRLTCPTYIMPVGATWAQQQSNLPFTAELCLKYGYRLTFRLHTAIFGNTTGT